MIVIPKNLFRVYASLGVFVDENLKSNSKPDGIVQVEYLFNLVSIVFIQFPQNEY